ncbi:uncharacterized protein [Ptychodera flava]|uniref:uncharacterized protein n=1 Tax=Ptychodera flava TaxID=63121 RepID=UPI00396A5B22
MIFKTLPCSLSEEQQKCVELALLGHNIFITGPAGSGKSYLVKKIYENFTRTTSKNVQIVCPTGAACSIYDDLPEKSKTIHSFFGIGLADQAIQDIIKNAKEYVATQLREVDVLIIDEVSMVSARLFNVIATLSKVCREGKQSFGGIQVIAIGDFHQLPPVPSHVDDGEYPFQSPLWEKTFRHNMVLKTIYRQQHNQQEFLQALNSVRLGQCSPRTLDFLNTLKRSLPNPENQTHIYFHNADVDFHNICQLDKLTGQCHVFQAVDKGDMHEVERRAIAPKKLLLKVGAPVMLVYNLSNSLHNGSTGFFKGVDENGNPVVAFEDSMIQVSVQRQVWIFKNDQELR